MIEFKGKPWEQQKGERDREYAFYLVFQGLGPTRKARDAQSKYLGGEKKHLAGSWAGPCAKFRWFDRAAAYDKHLGEKDTKAREDWMARSSEAQGRAMAHLSELVADAAESKDIEVLKKLIPRLHSLIGKGNAGNFIVQVHKALHGEKIQVQEVEILEFE